MQINIYEKPNQAGSAAAIIIASKILAKKNCVMGLATGSSPLDTYAELVRLNREGVLDFSGVRSYNLDEYESLGPSHPCSYRKFMDDNLFSKINIRYENTHVPDGVGGTYGEYDDSIEQDGGIDIQLLGIGINGHIGFNEPSDEFAETTHRVKLTDSTLAANARFFEKPEDMPRYAVTMGIGSIMKARSIVLIALGESKAKAVRAAVLGEITPRMPASVLQRHPDAVLLLDRAAASLL